MRLGFVAEEEKGHDLLCRLIPRRCHIQDRSAQRPEREKKVKDGNFENGITQCMV